MFYKTDFFMNFSCILRFYCCCLLSGELNSEGGARVEISAPEAHKVQLDISDMKYDLVEDIIPMIDTNFCTLAGQPHRATAGLCMGGMKTRVITLSHHELFSHSPACSS
jgi:hypothetical protein